MIEREPPAPLGVVLGRNAEKLRGDRKTEDVAKAVTAAGLTWARARVVDLEAGRVVPRIETLMVLAAAFTDLLGRPVTLAELFAGSGKAIITGNTAAGLASVRAALSAEPVALPKPKPVEALLREYPEMVPDPDALATIPRSRFAKVWRLRKDCGEPEQRTAEALGVSLGRLAEAMADLWGHTLTVERDRRAGPHANRQTRGQITRILRDELRKAIDDGDR